MSDITGISPVSNEEFISAVGKPRREYPEYGAGPIVSENNMTSNDTFSSSQHEEAAEAPSMFGRAYDWMTEKAGNMFSWRGLAIGVAEAGTFATMGKLLKEPVSWKLKLPLIFGSMLIGGNYFAPHPAEASHGTEH